MEIIVGNLYRYQFHILGKEHNMIFRVLVINQNNSNRSHVSLTVDYGEFTNDIYPDTYVYLKRSWKKDISTFELNRSFISRYMISCLPDE